jgi:hypothetical protein
LLQGGVQFVGFILRDREFGLFGFDLARHLELRW